ncbi:MAG: DUF6531 domain-containing protein, partial [Thermodesulfobacteriota bacterium]
MSPKSILILILALVAVPAVPAAAGPLAETREVIWSGEGEAMAAKAEELGSPAAIYEFVRNSHEYALYHGSRSNSINTFGGRRGSDVDIASVLIAMYRSQGIPARYAVATVSAPAAGVANWLGVKDIDLAASIMDDQGIQQVAMSPDRQAISFEHVWVQVQVPYDDYRGAVASSVNCTTTPGRCRWIDVDPSYKLREYHNQGIDVYGQVNFDYERYYNAIKNDDAEYRDKSPLEIYEDQILTWLRANHPGKTLEDVADPGKIIPVQDGILPASLPYQVVSAVQTCDSVQEHDEAGGKGWAKFVRVHYDLGAFVFSGGLVGPFQLLPDSPRISLADLSTRRLTISYFEGNGIPGDPFQHHQMTLRLGGEIIHTPVLIAFDNEIADFIGRLFNISINLDGAPGTTAGEEDSVIDVDYQNLIFGGYYLIGTGGDSSNWSQVHRAAELLLNANLQYPVVNLGDVPHVDQNRNGSIEGGEPRLIDDPVAQDALTGGLLYVAMSQYFARFAADVHRLGSLNHVASPIEGFVGVVSSTHEVDYLGDTPFSVMPGGLLIDMKGQKFTGIWRVDAPATAADEHFELIGRNMSSLEHEIWQELTGFDAVSTVRGVQMALANGAPLLLPANTGAGSNMAAQYAGFGFTDTDPPGFATSPRDVFSTRPVIWTGAAETTIEFLKRQVDSGSQVADRTRWQYGVSSYHAQYISCIDSCENQLRALPGGTQLQAQSLCNHDFPAGTASQFLVWLEDYYLHTVIPDYIGQALFDTFDRNQGFVPTDYVYRAYNASNDNHSAERVQVIRDDVMIGERRLFPDAQGQMTLPGRWAYVIPGRRTSTGFNTFSVFVEKISNPTDGHLVSQSYSIANDSFTAGGGWVDGSQALEAASVPSGSLIQPSFNNEVFTDQSLVAQTNNDLVRTPSTADPVSTVTGNMYHDETDLTIRGRGLDYVFTRSYNSAPARTDRDGPLGFGWTHSYAMELRSNDFGACPNCTAAQDARNGNSITSSITYVDERGGEHTSILNADGSPTRSVADKPPGEFETLRLNYPSAGVFTLTFRNGVSYVFTGPSTLVNTPGQTARLAMIVDPYGSQLVMGYDGSGRLTSVTDNLGVPGRTGLTLTYHGSTPHVKTVADWTGRTWTYNYTSNNLTSVTSPLNKTTTITYHPDSHLLHEIILPELRDGQPVKTAFSYYRNNRAFQYANALQGTETLDYDLYRQRTRVTDPRGFVRKHFYDPDNGALIKLEEPDGGILFFGNNADGLRFAKIDPLGYGTVYSYRQDRGLLGGASDTFGNVTLESDALGNRTEYDYNFDLYDQVTRIKDKNGNERFLTYSSTTDAGTYAVKGRLQKEEVMLAGVRTLLATYNYYPDGTLRLKDERIDPAQPSRRRYTFFEYEANGLNLQRKTVWGNTGGGPVVLEYTYDALGRLETETLTRRTSAVDETPVALTTTFGYDALDRVTHVTDPAGTIRETIFDANGQVYQEKVHHRQADGT